MGEGFRVRGQHYRQAGRSTSADDRSQRLDHCGTAIRGDTQEQLSEGGRQEDLGAWPLILRRDGRQRAPSLGVGRDDDKSVEQSGEGIVEGAAHTAELVDAMDLAQVRLEGGRREWKAALRTNEQRLGWNSGQRWSREMRLRLIAIRHDRYRKRSRRAPTRLRIVMLQHSRLSSAVQSCR